MSRNVDDTYEMPNVLHRPFRVPREGTPAEGIYLKLWQDWVSRNHNEWAAIFCTKGPVRQRAASVAASFMTFMGCNVGYAFTRLAEQYAAMPHFLDGQRAFVAAWAVENMRHHGASHGLRMSEYMLAKDYPVDAEGCGQRVIWKNVPVITQDDNDILEGMVRWWSGAAARALRAKAKPLIEAANKRAFNSAISRLPTIQ